MATLGDIQRTTKRKAASVGRGGKRGKTSGRGMKGQKARSGNKPRPELRDTIKKFPKMRGYGKNRSRTINSSRFVAVPVSLSALNVFSSGDTVTPDLLVERGVVKTRGGRVPAVKIVANGEITSPVAVKDISVSENAKKAIESAGGSVS